MADDEIVVSIDPIDDLGGDTAVTVEPQQQRTEKTAPAGDAVSELESQYRDMQARLETERQSRVEAEAAAQRARDEALAANSRASESQYDGVIGGLDAAKSEADSAAAEYEGAFEKGDARAMATAQRKIARAEARIVRLEEAKSDLEVRAEEAKTRKPATTERPAQRERADETGDPAEVLARRSSAKTADWIRAHPDYFRDPQKNARVIAAHHNAIADGIAVDTPQYFAAVEKFVGIGSARSSNGSGNGQQQRRSAPVTVAAPVAPVGGAANGGKVEVTLTRGEAATATDGTLVWNMPDPTGKNRWKIGDPIGVQEMARRKMYGIKNHLYDKTQYDQ